jgi:hypothetical protein
MLVISIRQLQTQCTCLAVRKRESEVRYSVYSIIWGNGGGGGVHG